MCYILYYMCMLESVKCLCIESLTSHWVKKITITDFQRAVISIMLYKMLHDVTKLLVSVHTLLNKCLTIVFYFSLNLSSDLLFILFLYDLTWLLSENQPCKCSCQFPVSTTLTTQVLYEDCQNWTWIFWKSVILVKCSCIESLMFCWAKKITMTVLESVHKE